MLPRAAPPAQAAPPAPIRRRRLPSLDLALCALGVLAGTGAAVVHPAGARAAAAQDWSPFVLVAGLLMVGLAADADGLFAAAGALLSRLARHDATLLLGTVALVAAVTAVLNLDTAVAFVTPVLVHATARRRHTRPAIVAASVLVANAASLLLPGANLTNLIVLGHGSLTGSRFASAVAPASLTAVGFTTVALAVALAIGIRHRPTGPSDATAPSSPSDATAPSSPSDATAPSSPSDATAPSSPARPAVRLGAGAGAVAAVAVLVLVLRSPAVPVLGVGLAASAAVVLRHHVRPAGVVAAVGPASLTGLFGVAVALGTVGRAWAGLHQLLDHLGRAPTAALAAGVAVAVNNLPAASLLSARTVAHPLALLVGLNVGPNLAVTGSLSWLLWARAVRHAGTKPPTRTAMGIGGVSAPLAIAAAVAVLALTGH